jgi:hypothetical protein
MARGIVHAVLSLLDGLTLGHAGLSSAAGLASLYARGRLCAAHAGLGLCPLDRCAKGATVVGTVVKVAVGTLIHLVSGRSCAIVAVLGVMVDWL